MVRARALPGKEDPQLFLTTAAWHTREDLKTALATRLGELPPEPETGFIGRSRELLALQRLLRRERYAVVRGQGGEGKTALAAEFARWMVRSHQIRRAAFVSVEMHSSRVAVLDAHTLRLLAPALRSRGVEKTRASLIELMAEMEQKFPGSREKSVFASVELSLRRLSTKNRERARVLGVFYGAVDLNVLRVMMDWEKADVTSLAGELIETGLETLDPFDHLTLKPGALSLLARAARCRPRLGANGPLDGRDS